MAKQRRYAMQSYSPQLESIAWSVEGFAAFWAKPNAARVAMVLTPDVAGYWPRQQKPFLGAEDYVRPIAQLLRLVPDFRLQVEDHGARGDTNFVRWTGTGTLEGEALRCEGVDCLRLRGGKVFENRIYSDHEIFAWLASAVWPSR
jgi:ketosteroid isomerase-like protein